MKATVPGCVHTDLLAAGKIPDPFFGMNELAVQWVGEVDWVYEKEFELDAAFLARPRAELVFEGLDTFCRVELNGEPLLEADNMFRSWRILCGERLRLGRNLLCLRFANVFDRCLPLIKKAPCALEAVNDQSEVRVSPYVRKAPYHFGWDWGPRLVTCGAWRPVRLEARSGGRVAGIYPRLKALSARRAEYSVEVEVESPVAGLASVELELAGGAARAEAMLALEPGMNAVSVPLSIEEPRLWWTKELGEPHLYTLRATASFFEGEGSREFARDSAAAPLGVRELRFVREEDAHGRSFRFELNGRPLFIKGACWIPADSFPSRVDRSRYDRLVGEAAAANMNMLRVWGGGTYEAEAFYDACDREGVLVWQDFMFACATYPGDAAFLASARAEAEDNVRRLRGRPSLALWCGNNENLAGWWLWGWRDKLGGAERALGWKAYEDLYRKTLADAVARLDPDRGYIDSSPLADYSGRPGLAREGEGDLHYWGVWHGGDPFSDYEKRVGRFMSEYGFQSHPEAAMTPAYLPPGDRTIGSAGLLHHQRCYGKINHPSYGERVIQDYMRGEYGVPAGFDDYLYLAQHQQAEGVRVAMEAHRRAKAGGYCAGTLYWQLDDCWPGASWSSLDYWGNPKALHRYAARAYAPLLVSATRREGKVELWAVSDLRAPLEGCRVELLAFELATGARVAARSFPFGIAADGSLRVASLPEDELLRGRAPVELAFRLRLVDGAGALRSSGTLKLAPFKELALADPGLAAEIAREGAGFRIELRAARPAFGVALEAPGIPGRFDEDWFDLFPGELMTARFSPAPGGSVAEPAFRAAFRASSLRERLR